MQSVFRVSDAPFIFCDPDFISLIWLKTLVLPATINNLYQAFKGSGVIEERSNRREVLTCLVSGSSLSMKKRSTRIEMLCSEWICAVIIFGTLWVRTRRSLRSYVLKAFHYGDTEDVVTIGSIVTITTILKPFLRNILRKGFDKARLRPFQAISGHLLFCIQYLNFVNRTPRSLW